MVAAKKPSRLPPPSSLEDPRQGQDRLLEIGKLLLTSTEIEDVLENIARGMCDVAGYARCLILGVEGATRQQERGRAGKGIRLADARQVQQLLTDVPVLASVLEGSGPLVLQPEQVTASIPVHFVELFLLKGTLIALPLGDRRLGLLGIVIIDRGGARFTPADSELQTLVDFTDLATLALQKAALVHDNQRLATVLEHTRFAIELHDGVTQTMFAAALTLQEALDHQDLPLGVVALLQRAQGHMEGGSKQLRRALLELTQDDPAADHDADYESAIRSLTLQFSERAGIGADLELRGSGNLPSTPVLELLRCTAREGLDNVLAHASATQVTVVLRRSDHWWMMEVHDDGVGDATELRRRTAGSDERSGLRKLQRDAVGLGGRMWVSDSPRLGGVQLTVSLPVAHD